MPSENQVPSISSTKATVHLLVTRKLKPTSEPHVALIESENIKVGPVAYGLRVMGGSLTLANSAFRMITDNARTKTQNGKTV